MSSEWSNGYGAYYLIGKVGGTCNQLNNGNASWFDETLRTPGVLGPYKMSLVKYGYLSNSYSDGLNQNLQYANPAPASHPVNGAPGYLKTTQGFWLVLQIRVPTLQYNYLTNQYEFTGNYYEPEQSHGFSSPVASCAYNYHE